MFEKDLQARLQRIFDFKKTRFDKWSEETPEQETLFIDVARSNVKLHEKRQTARVEGTLTVFANYDKLPYGYFNKRIANAMTEDFKKFFFHAIDLNDPEYVNIARRTVGFVFFFEAQYDPSLGTITSIDFQEGEDL